MSEKGINLGKKGEEIALRYLKKQGYKIIEQNYRSHLGEIDLIAKEKDILVFIEVKTRQSLRFGPPELAVHWHKQQQIAKVALDYLNRYKDKIDGCRFDVVAISWRDKEPEVTLFKAAFEV